MREHDGLLLCTHIKTCICCVKSLESHAHRLVKHQIDMSAADFLNQTKAHNFPKPSHALDDASTLCRFANRRLMMCICNDPRPI